MRMSSVIYRFDFRYLILTTSFAGFFINKRAGELFEEVYKDSYAYNIVSDFLNSILYTTEYSITKESLKLYGANDGAQGYDIRVSNLQKGFFNTIVSPVANNLVSLKDHENFSTIQSSSSKILVGAIFSATLLSKKSYEKGSLDFSPKDYYSVIKPVIKHSSILVCKLYFLPSTLPFDIGQKFIINSSCNMLGEVVEGLFRMAYSYAFEEKVDYYYLEEILSDMLFSIYKTFHHKLEEKAGSFLKSLEQLETFVDLFPAHYYVGGVIRRFISKMSLKLSEKMLEHAYYDNNIVAQLAFPEEKNIVMYLGMKVLCLDDGKTCRIEMPSDECNYFSRELANDSARSNPLLDEQSSMSWGVIGEQSSLAYVPG